MGNCGCLGSQRKLESPSNAVQGPGGSQVSATSQPPPPPPPPLPRRSEDEVLQSTRVRSFTFDQLRKATRNFCPDTVLGEGGFGIVFRGFIDGQTFQPSNPVTGVAIAVKRLNPEGQQGRSEWVTELNYLGELSHPNVVKLIGYCTEGAERLLVYEFMPLGSLECHLFNTGPFPLPLPWKLRLKVALDAARGLAYLHVAEIKVIYRDFKTSNILLDEKYTAKLSDFGLARDGPTGDRTHVTTRLMGTHGYAAPEYLETGHLTPKSDVYGFGVVLLEMLTGLRCLDDTRPSGQRNLVEWVKPYLISRRRIVYIMDRRLAGNYSLRGAHKVAAVAYLCLARQARKRPSMDEVVVALEHIHDTHGNASPEFQRMRLTFSDDPGSRRKKSMEDVGKGKAAYPLPSPSHPKD